MKKDRSLENLLIAVLALTVASLYIFISIHKALQKSPKPILTPEETRILDPKLDESLLKELQERRM